MRGSEDNLIKQRDIAFCELHENANQARTAAKVLLNAGNVLSATPVTPRLLRVKYDLLDTTFAHIEAVLVRKGLHLANHLKYRIKSALYHYSETTQRANLGCPNGESNCTRRIFASNYQRRVHGCQDNRPEHWRRYL